MAYLFYINISKAIYFLEISSSFLGLRKKILVQKKKKKVTAFKNYAKLNLGNTYFSPNSEVLN